MKAFRPGFFRLLKIPYSFSSLRIEGMVYETCEKPLVWSGHKIRDLGQRDTSSVSNEAVISQRGSTVSWLLGSVKDRTFSVRLRKMVSHEGVRNRESRGAIPQEDHSQLYLAIL